MFSKEIRKRNSKRLRRIAFGDCLCAWQGQRQKGRTKNHRENPKKTNQTRNHFDLPSALPSVPFALPFASPFALPFCFCLLIWILICLLLWAFALHFALFCVLLGSSWDRSVYEKLTIAYFRHSSHPSYTSTHKYAEVWVARQIGLSCKPQVLPGAPQIWLSGTARSTISQQKTHYDHKVSVPRSHDLGTDIRKMKPSESTCDLQVARTRHSQTIFMYVICAFWKCNLIWLAVYVCSTYIQWCVHCTLQGSTTQYKNEQ